MNEKYTYTIYSAPDNSQNFNCYSYCLNNPLKYTDPSGEFFTWSIFTGGLSFGINLTPIGIPIGFGTNFGWDGGFSMGTYFEAGPRIGGTCLGMGATASQSYDYNFTQKNFSTTFGIGAYASVACFTANAGLSNTYDFTNGYWSQGWNVGAGFGIGNGASGVGIGINYGSSGFCCGVFGHNCFNTTFDVNDQGVAGNISEAKANAKSYDGSSLAETNDQLLKARVNEVFNVSEGDMGISQITTVPNSKKYGMTSNGKYVKLRNGKLVGGYFDIAKKQVCVSPYYANNSDNISFKAVVGHELIHAYHFYRFGNFTNKNYTESVAYKYTSDIYMSACQFTASYLYYKCSYNYGAYAPFYYYQNIIK